MKEQLTSLGIQALSALLPLVVTLLGVLLTALTVYIQSKVKSQRVNDALDRFDNVVMSAVKEVQQTFVDKLDDKQPKSLEDAKQAAISAVKSHYGSKGIDELKKVLGWEDADKVLAMKIEEKVHDMKLERASAGIVGQTTK
jgi:hypothetical protein